MLFVAALAVVLLAAPLPGEREEHAIAPEMDLESGGRSPKSLECGIHAGVVENFDYADTEHSNRCSSVREKGKLTTPTEARGTDGTDGLTDTEVNYDHRCNAYYFCRGSYEEDYQELGTLNGCGVSHPPHARGAGPLGVARSALLAESARRIQS